MKPENATGRAAGPVVSRRAAITTLGLTAAGVVAGTVTAAPALASVGDAQLMVATDHSGLQHTIRFSSGGWWPQGFATAPGVPMEAVAGANNNGELHVIQVGRKTNIVGKVFHAIRFGDGSWTGPNEATGFTGSVPGEFGAHDVAAAFLGNVLHVVAVSEYGLFKTARYPNGGWDQWARPSPTWALRLSQVAMAATSHGELHVAATDGRGGLLHRARLANGTWTPFVGLDTPFATTVAMSEAGTWMHLAVCDGDWVYHRVRYRDGNWTPFLPVGTVPTNTFMLGAAGFSDGYFQLAIGGNRNVYHQARLTDAAGNWTGWGYVGSIPSGDSIQGIDLAGQRF
jgi:hypothetical protein